MVRPLGVASDRGVAVDRSSRRIDAAQDRRSVRPNDTRTYLRYPDMRPPHRIGTCLLMTPSGDFSAPSLPARPTSALPCRDVGRAVRGRVAPARAVAAGRHAAAALVSDKSRGVPGASALRQLADGAALRRTHDAIPLRALL